MAVTWWQWLAGYIYTRTLSVLCTARLYNYCVFKLPPTSSAQCRRVWVCVQSASNWFRWFKQSINTTDSARYDCMILSHSLMCLILLFLPNTTVPSPSVSISHDGGTESLYSGTSLTLTCVVTVSSNAVDISQVVVNSTWSKDGSPLPTQTRAVVTPFLEFSNSNNSFMSTINFSPLDDAADSGVYSCSVTLSPLGNYIEGSSTNQFINITVQSELMMHEVTMCDFMRSFSWSELPDPVIDIIRNGSTIIGTELSLHCSVDHVEGLINPPIIIWSWVLDSAGSGPSVMDTAVGSLLHFNPLMAANRGTYWCNVTIEVPEIDLFLNASSAEISIGMLRTWLILLVLISLISTDPQHCLNTTFFPTNATLLWNFNQTNGYNLTCDRSMPNDNDSDSLDYLQNEESCIIIGLNPFTSYTCNVTELVDNEERPLTQCLFTTAQAGEYSKANQTHVLNLCVESCSSWTSS